MLVAHSLEEAAAYTVSGIPHAVTIGNFDGVHVGHRTLIRTVREKAAEFGARSVLVTFDPHPVHVVRGAGAPGIITPLPRKLELFEEAGIDVVLVLPFTKIVAGMSAEEFVKAVLVRVLGVKNLVIGYNFALGKNRSGNLATFERLGRRFEFAVTQVPPVVLGGETVSSSLIRERITSGEMEKAASLLGRMHTVDGIVIPGDARGGKLGYPTANIDFPEMLLPPFGAYATWIQEISDPPKGMMPPDPQLGEEPSPLAGPGGGAPCRGAPGGDFRPLKSAPRASMTSVGTNPTFGGGSVRLETHIFDFTGDLYDKKVRLYFAERLRGEIRFNSAGELVARLGRDAEAAKKALEREKKPC